MEQCAAFADRLGLPFVGGRADVPRMARELRIGLEEAGREARYAFFGQAAGSTNCSLVATAHTRDDSVETTLLNITRGCGLAGLAGIPEQRANIIRPLLPFSRSETRAYCDERSLWYHDDPANEDLSFSRARIRHRVMPELRSVNPGVDAAIRRLAQMASEEDRFLNGMAAAALERSEIPLNGPLRFLTLDAEAAFDLSQLLHLPPVLFRRACRLAFEALGAEVTFEQVQSILEACAQDSGSVTAEGGQAVAEWTAERITFRRLSIDEPFRHPLTFPGETDSEEFGWTLAAWESPSAELPAVRAALETEAAMASVRKPLYFRAAEPGDRMRPLGFDGSRKLADLLSEAGLTPAARRRLPIVCDVLGPIWAPGVCLDERARPVEGPVLRLRLSPLDRGSV
jgi:tRNA(Ile)-lysidine synthase